MKLKALAVANAIRIGSETKAYLMSEQYDMTIDGNIVWIECKKSGAKAFTTLFNVPYGEALEANEGNEHPPGAHKKKTKSA